MWVNHEKLAYLLRMFDICQCLLRFFLLAESWQHCLNTVQTEWVPRFQPKIWRKIQKNWRSLDFQDYIDKTYWYCCISTLFNNIDIAEVILKILIWLSTELLKNIDIDIAINKNISQAINIDKGIFNIESKIDAQGVKFIHISMFHFARSWYRRGFWKYWLKGINIDLVKYWINNYFGYRTPLRSKPPQNILLWRMWWRRWCQREGRLAGMCQATRSWSSFPKPRWTWRWLDQTGHPRPFPASTFGWCTASIPTSPP